MCPISSAAVLSVRRLSVVASHLKVSGVLSKALRAIISFGDTSAVLRVLHLITHWALYLFFRPPERFLSDRALLFSVINVCEIVDGWL